ncbi:MAG TPA: FAD-dependent oxidoreductase, partial [Pyrinomonadaceae bacterium]|nr:FAD-dependent oxidoreductase [Pyrinomonadaceae bacterium]
MANVVVAGGGFAGVVAAESLATRLDPEHQITLVSRSDQFIFYPALVRLAFGKCELADVSFDLRQALPSRRVRFIKAEIARVDPAFRRVILGHGEVEGDLSYDYLILALGRRLATERITGYFEYANHLLDVEGALKFGEALRQFNKGRAVLGQCPGARLPVPVYETAFALSRYLTERGVRDSVGITIISPDPPTYQLGDAEVARALRTALETHNVEFLPDFSVDRVTATAVMPESRHGMNYDLLMLLPPFRGPGPVTGLTISQEDGYIGVDETMRVKGAAQMYA